MMAEVIKVLPTSVLLLFSIAIIIVAVALVTAIVLLVRYGIKHIKKAKIGNTELDFTDGNSKESESNKSQASHAIAFHKDDSLTSVISSVIGYSIDMAYEASSLRQQLFSDQVRNAKSKFSMVKTMILGEYIKIFGNFNVDFVDIVLENLIDSIILVKLEKAFQADKFAEKTKDQILELYKPFIESAYSDFKLEAIKIIKNIDSENLHSTESKLISCVESQKDLIKKSIIECFEYAYNESTSYTKNVEELNRKSSAQINNTLRSYFIDNPSLISSLPNIWNETMSPNSVAGGR